MGLLHLFAYKNDMTFTSEIKQDQMVHVAFDGSSRTRNFQVTVRISHGSFACNFDQVANHREHIFYCRPYL